MKRINFIIALIVSVFLSLLGASCARKRVESRTVVRFLSAPDVGGFSRELIKKFEQINPDIKIDMVEGPAATNIREDMYSASFMAKEDTYDLIYMDIAWLPKFAAQGWLKPLDELFTPVMRKDFFEGDINGSQYNGHIYRVPTQADGGMLYYRKDLLEARKIKPPETWSELMATAKALQSPPGLWGFVFQGRQYEGLVCDYLELAWGNGGTLLDEEGRVRVDESKAVEALGWLADAVHRDKIAPPGVLTFQEEESRHMFQEGHAVFMRNWPYAWNLLQSNSSVVKGKVGIIPMVHGPGGTSAATLGGWGYGISAFSKNSQGAWKFIEFATSVENQKLAFFKSGIIPTRSALFSDSEILEASPHMSALGKVLAYAKARPVHPSYARISDILQIHVSAALSLQEDPKTAMAKAAEEIRKVVKLK